MNRIKLSEIFIPERFRKDPGNIKELANSFTEFGQLQPIILDQSNVLVAGYRRLAAAAILKWEEIGFERQEELTELRRREIETEENIRRKQFDWKEEVAAIAEIHRLRQDSDPKWTAKQTAELIGKTPRLAQYAVKLSKSLDIPEIAEAETMLGAIQRLTTKEQLERKLEEVSQLKQKEDWQIIEGDAREVLPKIRDETIDCIITDPPWGIGLNYRGKEQFDDQHKRALERIEAVVPDMFRVLKRDCWAVIFFDTVMMQWLIDILIEAGFNFKSRVPCIWYKPNKRSGAGRNPSQIMTVAYESFILAAKGDPVLVQKGRPNVFVFETLLSADRTHYTQKSSPLAEDIVTSLTVGGQVILDPFCGSGEFGAGAIRQQRRYIGIEADPESVKKAQVNLAGALK